MSHSILDLQLMWDRLSAVVEEQARALQRTSFSPIVRECGDLSAGVFDPAGRMLAQAVTGTPGHVNSMAESVVHFLAAFPPETMRPGDAYITNDPWKGTGHLNDFVVTTPVFRGGRLVALFSCTSHITDIGGIGFGPDGTDLFMEGLALPFLKLMDGGKVNETLIAIAKANTRLPIDTEGDIYSLLNCNDVGSRRLLKLMDEFRLDDLSGLGRHIFESTGRAMRQAIGALPQGTWRYTMTLDGYDSPIELQATTTVAADHVAIDFSGTSAQVTHGINVPLAYTRAYTAFGLMCAIAPRVPNNAGSLGAFRITAPERSIVNALYPAAVSTRHIIGQMLPDMVFGCLSQAVPDRCPAEGTSCLWNMTFRNAPAAKGQRFAFTMTSNGGTGARPSKDGLNATAFPSGVRGTPVEIVEAQTPLVFWRKELRPGSGGGGNHKGGDGQVIEVAHGEGEPFEILAAFDRIAYPPRGRDGGADGAAGALATASGRKLRGKGTQRIEPGERLVVQTPGGGGLGRREAAE
jgi:N-methylhydantoinase B